MKIDRNILNFKEMIRLRHLIKHFLLKKFKFGIINYNNNTIFEEMSVVRLLLKIREEERVFQTFEELYNIYNLAKHTMHLKGDIAEVGVYKGGSAKIIVINSNQRKIHLFDSFEGMLKTNTNVDLHKKYDFIDVSLDEVKKYLIEYDNIFFHKGWFPDSAKVVEEKIFSFVHLDVDLYQSTYDALNFFYKRMVKGGVLLSHDYSSVTCPGVKKAFDYFFENKEEIIIKLAGTTQCMVVKL